MMLDTALALSNSLETLSVMLGTFLCFPFENQGANSSPLCAGLRHVCPEPAPKLPVETQWANLGEGQSYRPWSTETGNQLSREFGGLNI